MIIPILKNIDREDALKNIPNLVLNQDGNFFITKRQFTNGNYKNLPILDYSFLDFSLYIDTATMITSRGCDGKCKYCSTPTFFINFKVKM